MIRPFNHHKLSNDNAIRTTMILGNTLKVNGHQNKYQLFKFFFFVSGSLSGSAVVDMSF